MATQGRDRTEGDLPHMVATRYRLTEGLVALGDDYFIQSDNGEQVFVINSRAIRDSDTVSLQDMQGTEICRFRPRLESIPQVVDITDALGEVLATVRRQNITPLRDQFMLELSGKQSLEIQGDIIAHEFEMKDPSGIVASVSTRWFHARESYGVEIAPGQFDGCILAAVVALELMAGAAARR